MENLGWLEPEALLQMFVGSLSCALVIFLFVIGYVLVSRSNKAKKRPKVGTGSYSAGTGGLTSPTSPIPSAAGYAGGEEEAPPIDVSARLAGTGREAWLEEALSPSTTTPPVGKSVPHGGKEILRVVLDPSSGEIWTKVAGVPYRSLKDIRDRAVGERVLAAITHVLRFSNGMVATDQGVATLKLPPCDGVKIPAAFGALSGAREPGEMLRLVSDPDRGDFCVYAVERCYHRLADVADQAIGRCILEAITRLLQFSNGTLATNGGFGIVPVPSLGDDIHASLLIPPAPSPDASQSAIPSPSPATPPPGLQPSVPLSSSPSLLGEQERFLRSLMSQAPPQQPETPSKRPSLLGGLRRMLEKSSDEALPLLNLAEEINRIFQSKLALSPMAKTDAQVEANPDGGVRIRVGMVYYDTPDEVPDAYLRDILKLSIAEWEQS